MTKSLILALSAILTLAACAGADDPGSAMTDAEKLAEIRQMYDGYRSDFPEVEDISAEELLALRENRPVVIVDVRKTKERRISTIPGAITPEELGTLPEGALVVTYCTVGYRSGLHADKLRRQGIEVKNLAGSLLSWAHAGGDLVDAEGPTKRLHVYGKKWNLAPEAFEAVW
ncbi:MAG: rhodanese-like domain-containing protein [Acidobacteriota bacterium]